MPDRHHPDLFPLDALGAIAQALADRAAVTVGNVDGAGVAVHQDGTTVFAASNAFAGSVDAWQYAVEQGPCITAVETGAPVVIGSTLHEPRWPRFVDGAHERGTRSVLSLPLRVDSGVVGSLNLYSRTIDGFGDHSVEEGELFARPAALTLSVLGVVAHAADTADVAGMELEDAAVVAMAVGVLLSALPGSSVDAARARLTDLAAEQHVSLLVAAQGVVADPGRTR